MKKIEITITQTLELPDDCEVIKGQDDKFIKLGENYLVPSIEFMQTKNHSEKSIEFTELNEELFDVIFASVASEKIDITEA